MSRALGRYELVRPLARGGMAEVFLARRRAGGVEKLLVVKRIRAERAGDARFLDMFMKEARLSMSLAHQNIVPVFDFGRTGDQVFLAMERVEGKDLGSTLARAGRKAPPPLIAAFIAAECCQALDYAHRRKNPDGSNRGVVHRDVTPRNVLLSWSGEVKLTDFGIAAVSGDDTSKLAGTPTYMSPEQAKGETVDARTDLYAVGLVLREALTGERARSGDDRDAVLAAARTGVLAPWPAGELDPALRGIVDRATAIDPGDRYAGANEMLADLDAYIVAERAKHRGDAPALQIAAWLAEVWGAERDEPVVPDASLEPGPALMSFLDDGAHGTGTERSLAATAADEPEAEPREAAPAPSASPPPEPAPTPSAPEAPTPSRRRLAIAGAVVIAATAIAVIATRDRGAAAPPIAIRDAAALPADAALLVEADAPPDADVVAIADASELAPADTTIAARDAGAIADGKLALVDPRSGSARAGSATRTGNNPRVDAGSARVGSGSPRTGSGTARTGSGSARTGSGSAVAAGSAVVLRKVRINATPWAYFTVDGGPRMQTPKLLELAPGPHRIHFENSVLKVERTITLDVPADRDISYVEPLGR